MNKFEDAEAYLTPQDPIANNINTNRKCGASEISDAPGGGAQISANKANQGTGYKGVRFCYHKYD